MHRHDVTHGLAQVAKNAAALAHGTHDGGEVVVHQHNGRRLACDIGAAPAHGDPDVGGLECGSIIHAIACHGHDGAASLQRLHVMCAQMLVVRNRSWSWVSDSAPISSPLSTSPA